LGRWIIQPVSTKKNRSNETNYNFLASEDIYQWNVTKNIKDENKIKMEIDVNMRSSLRNSQKCKKHKKGEVAREKKKHDMNFAK
jgi:hypothetical protein